MTSISMCLLTGKIQCFRVSIVVAVFLTLAQLQMFNVWYNNTKMYSKPALSKLASSGPSVGVRNDTSGVQKPSMKKNMVAHGMKAAMVKPGATQNNNTVISKPKSKSLLSLFSSWDFSAEKQQMHRTILKLWTSWKPLVSPLVFTDDPVVKKEAAKYGWTSLPVTKNPKCRGPPIVTKFYEDALQHYDSEFYGFANSDIAFGNGLIETLRSLRNSGAYANKSVLIVGRRTNFRFLDFQGQIDTPEKVHEVITWGTLVLRSTDYFFTNRNFPWHSIPGLSIGRPLIVRAILGFARMHNIDIIDATKTIEALHLTTRDGDKSSWHKPGVSCNEAIVRQNQAWNLVSLDFGHVECAKLETFRDKHKEIRVRNRLADTHICKRKHTAKIHHKSPH